MSSTYNTEEIILDVPLGESSGGTSQDTYTTGDILYSNATNTLEKLAIGETGMAFFSNNSTPYWDTMTLTSLGGTSLVGDGDGPDMSIRGLSTGTGISITDVGNTLEITNTGLNTDVTLSSLGGISLVGDGSGST